MDYSYPAKNLSPQPTAEVDDAENLTPAREPERSQKDDSDTAAQAILSEEAASERKLSVLGRSLVFKGELSAEEDLLIQGRVEGSIKHSAKNLTIGANGKVKADIDAHRVIVQGSVQGDIRGNDIVTVEPSANVQGNIFAPRVGLKDGAKFKGSIDMDYDPAQQLDAKSSKSSSAGKPRAKARAAKKGEISDSNVDDLLDQSES